MLDIRLIQPLDEATTEPLQQVPNVPGPGGGVATDHVVAPGDGWRPVAGDAPSPPDGDRSRPRPVRFAWEYPPALAGSARAELQIGRERSLDAPEIRLPVCGTACDVLHLYIGERYFWKVAVRDAAGCLHTSPVWTFRTHPQPPRWIHVPGTTNVRDMGGWALPGNRRVRQGLIYRSSELDNHVDLAPEGRRVLIDALNIRTDLDLRTADEVNGPVLDPARVIWVHMPVDPYAYIARDGSREQYRDLFRFLAQPGHYPILFHCWGGADRGGTVALLLNALLGVCRSDLIRDYELTSLSIWAERSHRSENFKSLLDILRLFAERPDDLNAQAEGFLRAVGVESHELDAIRRLLTEACPPLPHP